MQQFLSNSPQETEQIGARLTGLLPQGGLLALFGGMGMGKTVLVKGLAKGLGVTVAVTSPTYTIVNEYTGQLKLYHFDMYRVQSEDDLYSTGYFDYLDRGNLLVVEWSENILSDLPPDCLRVQLSRGGEEHQRVITVYDETDLREGKLPDALRWERGALR